MKKNHFYIALSLILFSGFSAFAILGAKQNYEKSSKHANYNDFPKSIHNETNFSIVSKNGASKIKENQINMGDISYPSDKMPKNYAALPKLSLEKNSASPLANSQGKSVIIKDTGSLLSLENKAIAAPSEKISEKISEKQVNINLQEKTKTETIVVTLNKNPISNVASIDKITKGNRITIKIPRRE